MGIDMTQEAYEKVFAVGRAEIQRREAARKKTAEEAAQMAKDLSDLRRTADAVLLSMSGPVPTGEAGLTDEEVEEIYTRSKHRMTDSRELSERERARLEKQIARAMGIGSDDQC